MNQKLKYILIIAIFFSLIIIPKLVFSTNEIYDSFNYSSTSLAQTAINDEVLESYPYENTVNTINRHANGWSSRWAVTSSIASISLVTGISPRDLQSVPICAFGILIMAYLVASKLTKSNKMAAFYTLLIAFDPTVNSLTNGTYIQGWGFIFYFMLIYTIMIVVEKKYYLALTGKKKYYREFCLYAGLIAFEMAMMHFTYYSTFIYGTIMLFIVGIGLYARKMNLKTPNKKHIILIAGIAIIAFFALFFIESTVSFTVGRFGGFFGSFADFVINTANRLFGADAKAYVGIFSYLLIFIPIFILTIKWLGKFKKTKNLADLTWEDIIVLSFLFTGLVNVIMYTGLGFVDLKYIIMFFSLSALYAIGKINYVPLIDKKIKAIKIPKRQVFTLLLTILFIMKFVVYIGPIMESGNIGNDEELNWLVDNNIRGTNTISGLRTGGEIMLLQVENENDDFNSYVYSSTYLDRLIAGNVSTFENMNENIDYVVMTEINMEGYFNVGNWNTWNSEVDPNTMIGYYPFAQKVFSSPEISLWYISLNDT